MFSVQQEMMQYTNKAVDSMELTFFLFLLFAHGVFLTSPSDMQPYRQLQIHTMSRASMAL